MLLQPIPLGYCQCGCGDPAGLAAMTNGRLGVRAGEPNRYIHGHHAAARPACYASAPDDAVARLPIFGGRKVVAYSLIDADMWPVVTEYRWRLNQYSYVRTAGADKRAVSLHRLVMGFAIGDERQVDHINRDRLDNRRENLRESNPQLQAQNRRGRAGTSPYRGVCWAKDTRKWQATCRVNGQWNYLGQYEDELEAARVASAFRAKHMPHSEDARTVE